MKKESISDIIANVEGETKLKQVKKWWEDETGEKVSKALVREAAESLAMDGRIKLEEGKVKPVK